MGKYAVKNPKQKQQYKYDKSKEKGEPVEVWLNNSMDPQDFEHLKMLILQDQYDGRGRVCVSYACQYQKLTETQIEELSVITSPLREMMTQVTPENIAIATAILSVPNEEEQREIADTLVKSGMVKDKIFEGFLKQYAEGEYSPSKGVVQDRLDWVNIRKYQKFSNTFYNKWQRLMPKVSSVMMGDGSISLEENKKYKPRMHTAGKYR